jgi:hypothetical protein
VENEGFNGDLDRISYGKCWNFMVDFDGVEYFVGLKMEVVGFNMI